MGIVDSLAAALLTRLLAGWVDTVDPSQLRVSAVSGEVQVERLALSRDALRKFELPVDVRCGVLQRLRMVVPWKNLATTPTEITVDGVYLIVSPIERDAGAFDPEAERERMRNVKKKILQIVELLNSGGTANAAEDAQATSGADGDSFTSRSFAKVIANLRVRVGSVHFRYEDATSYVGGRPFAFGFTLQSLQADACDAQWKPAFVPWKDSVMRKRVVLRNAAVYWDSNCDRVVYRSPEELCAALAALIYRDGGFAPAPLLRCAPGQRVAAATAARYPTAGRAGGRRAPRARPRRPRCGGKPVPRAHCRRPVV
jgi:vacuolar protein sorting-associated protein 13D